MVRQVEYILSGLVALYIVFMTRPAPNLVVSLLGNPVTQLLTLGAVVYVGATQSLLVALLLSIAFVASVPSREYLDPKEQKPVEVKGADNKKKDRKHTEEEKKKEIKPAMVDSSLASTKETFAPF